MAWIQGSSTYAWFSFSLTVVHCLFSSSSKSCPLDIWMFVDILLCTFWYPNELGRSAMYTPLSTGTVCVWLTAQCLVHSEHKYLLKEWINTGTTYLVWIDVCKYNNNGLKISFWLLFFWSSYKYHNPHLFRIGNWSLERSSNLPNSMQLLSVRVETCILPVLVQRLCY